MNARNKSNGNSGYAKKSAKHSKSKLIPVAFAASAEDIKRWKKAADAEGRSLAWWIRLRMLAMDAQEQERTARAVEHADA
jgi:hypothetical protein